MAERELSLEEKAARTLCAAWQVKTCNREMPETTDAMWCGWLEEARATLREVFDLTDAQMQQPASAWVAVPSRLVRLIREVARYFTPGWRLGSYGTPSTHTGAVYDMLECAERHGMLATRPGAARDE